MATRYDNPEKRHTMIAWMEDKPGVLNRVSGLFGRRNFNIESLTVGHSETKGISRMTFVVRGTNRDMHQVRTQLNKIINVTDIQDVTYEPTIMRELALIRVKADSETRAEVMQLVDIFRASIVDVDMDSVMIQIVGKDSQIDSLIALLDNFGIEEMVRTGRVAMRRGAAVHKNEEQEAETAVSTNGYK